ncbi:hypothetical protein B0J18DRAFT_52952 [Chaetomium sp. MPI-SDFR-AT-0129]|nr:hypothetical protein B0J18DRAFT_52952 [Chaetomium sp. MPI-SDFR-AT-0129]
MYRRTRAAELPLWNQTTSNSATAQCGIGMQEKTKTSKQQPTPNRPICLGTAGDAKISQGKPWKPQPQRAIVSSISKPLAAVAAELQCPLDMPSRYALPMSCIRDVKGAAFPRGKKQGSVQGGGGGPQANHSPEPFRQFRVPKPVDVIPTNGRAQHPTPAEWPAGLPRRTNAGYGTEGLGLARQVGLVPAAVPGARRDCLLRV